LHCHAGCTTEAVCARTGIELLELSVGNGSTPRIVAEYDYTDKSGTLLFQVVRYDPKGFRQRRPDGNGGWIWNLTCVQRVLYRLPEVLAANEVHVFEGEKDCESARSLGVVATCNPGGAGKWRDEYSETLRGKRVVIIADADEPGRRHAQQVAESLHDKAASVKVLELPNAKDLSEWVERGGRRDALLELIRNAPEWRPLLHTMKSGLFLTSLRDLLSEPEENVSWLLADKLPAGGISILSAKPKVGKSTLARCLALAVARGEPFLGCQTTQGAVIYLALEEKRSEVRRHFADLGATGEETIHIHCAAAPKDAMPELCRLTRELKPALVIIDPLFKFVRVADEKAYAETCQAIEPILTLARETGAHVMLVHHSGKAERADATDAILGSTAIFGGVDAALILKRTDRYRTLQSCQRYGVDWPETVLEFDPDPRSLSLGAEKSEAETGRISQQILDYLRGSEQERTREEIEAQVEGKTGPTRKALRLLVEEGKIVREGTGRRGDPFRYSFLFPCSPYIAGTREQETVKCPEPRINTGDILVPKPSPDSILVPAPRERHKRFEEGEL
jgi:5S rRNA maturation endonuclease (ribonuclease M5)